MTPLLSPSTNQPRDFKPPLHPLENDERILARKYPGRKPKRKNLICGTRQGTSQLGSGRITSYVRVTQSRYHLTGKPVPERIHKALQQNYYCWLSDQLEGIHPRCEELDQDLAFDNDLEPSLGPKMATTIGGASRDTDHPPKHDPHEFHHLEC